jgi:hypothetical protein
MSNFAQTLARQTLLSFKETSAFSSPPTHSYDDRYLTAAGDSFCAILWSKRAETCSGPA